MLWFPRRRPMGWNFQEEPDVLIAVNPTAFIA